MAASSSPIPSTRFEVMSRGFSSHRQRHFRHLIARGTVRGMICDRSHPTCHQHDLANAWVYAEAFPDEIETEIRENNEVI